MLCFVCVFVGKKKKKLNFEKKTTKRTKQTNKQKATVHSITLRQIDDLTYLEATMDLVMFAWHGKQEIHRCWFLSLFYTLQYEFQPLWIIYVCVAYVYLYNEMFKRKKKETTFVFWQKGQGNGRGCGEDKTRRGNRDCSLPCADLLPLTRSQSSWEHG